MVINLDNLFTNTIKKVRKGDNPLATGARELIIEHNEGRIPNILGVYVMASDISTELSWKYSSVKIVGVTETYFKLTYFRETSSGTFSFQIVYY